ncbi:MAG: ABC transporter permease [Sphaerochaetaceae bacterium]|nr:ABC transporter permease [Sphaerochaetaceae bacterium]
MKKKSYFWLTVPALMFIVLVFFIPLFFLISKSFQTYIPGSLFTDRKLTFDNYKIIFKDSYVVSVYLRTLYISFISTLVIFVLGYPISLWISRLNKKYRGFIMTLVILPMIGGAMIQTMGWFTILMNYGVLNSILRNLNLIDNPIAFLGTNRGVIIGLVQSFLPMMIYPLTSSLLAIDPQILESARTLGAKPMRVFYKVTFPLSRPGALAGTILVFMACLTSFVTPSSLGQGKIQMFGTYAYQQAMLVMNWPFASAYSIFFLIMVGIIFIGCTKMVKGGNK